MYYTFRTTLAVVSLEKNCQIYLKKTTQILALSGKISWKNKRIVSNNRAESHPKNFIDVSTLFLGNDKDLHKFLQHTYAVLLHDIVYPTWSNG